MHLLLEFSHLPVELLLFLHEFLFGVGDGSLRLLFGLEVCLHQLRGTMYDIAEWARSMDQEEERMLARTSTVDSDTIKEGNLRT